MKETAGTTGLMFNEPLLWEKGKKGRTGFSMPRRDVKQQPVDENLKGSGPDFPDLSEVDIVRHYIPAFPVELFSRFRDVSAGLVHHEIQSPRPMKGKPPSRDLPWRTRCCRSPFHRGVLKLMSEMEQYLTEITGMDATTLQPAAGAQGELTGMLLFYAYHKRKGKPCSKILVPDTAHGTNPASASLCGYRSVLVKSNDRGVLSPTGG